MTETVCQLQNLLNPPRILKGVILEGFKITLNDLLSLAAAQGYQCRSPGAKSATLTFGSADPDLDPDNEKR
jgi:hypothetical protein